MSKKYRHGIIVGRFQVDNLHNGHKALIETAIAECDLVTIFLGISVVMDSSKDPLDFKTRMYMIQNLYSSVTVLPLRNMASDEKWSAQLDERISEISPLGGVQLFAGRDSFVNAYSGKFPVHVIDAVTEHNGTNRRKQIANAPIPSDEFRAGVIYGKTNQYPKCHPTVDILVYDKSPSSGKLRMLLGRKKHEDLWRVIGGFVDPEKDASLEAAARRECSEETGGIEIGNIKYVCSMQIDDWRYRQETNKIMTTFFTASYVFGKPVPSDDIAELRWFDESELNMDLVTPGHRALINAAYEQWQK